MKLESLLTFTLIVYVSESSAAAVLKSKTKSKLIDVATNGSTIVAASASTTAGYPRGFKDIQNVEFLVQESRNKNNRQSHNYKSAPKRSQYQSHNRHSDGKKGKGGYSKSDSFKGNQGYSDYSTYNRANKDKYADADHKQYGGKKGGSYGGGNEGGNSYGGSKGGSRGGHGGSGGRHQSGGGGKHNSEYSDNSNAYLDAGGGY